MIDSLESDLNELTSLVSEVDQDISLFKSKGGRMRKLIRSTYKVESPDWSDDVRRNNLRLKFNELMYRYLRSYGDLIESREWSNSLHVVSKGKEETKETKLYRIDDYVLGGAKYAILSTWYSGSFRDLLLAVNGKVSLEKLATLNFKQKMDLVSSPFGFVAQVQGEYHEGVFSQIFGNWFLFPEKQNDGYEVFLEMSDTDPSPGYSTEPDDREDFTSYNSYNDNVDLNQQSDDFWDRVG
ncbi:MAG: hypothetical protein EOP56_19415 [Sphingobacteriales bacterium]|nr:MAG: hypothetical protein EOP56_19415 [Sphingobacteriales bacterium]